MDSLSEAHIPPSPSPAGPAADSPPPPTPIPDIINWPIQKKKMWHGKGQYPSYSQIQSVAEAAVADGLETLSREELTGLVRASCRDARRKAAADRKSVSARLRRDYYDVVTRLLEGGELKP
ncbi:hypothetical protein VTK56DRAFT_3258 [Thermocarpiscus australiensis]